VELLQIVYPCLAGTGLLEIKYERDGECGVGRTTSQGRAQATGIKHLVKISIFRSTFIGYVDGKEKATTEEK
jgi:hypothetical protein